MQLQTLVVLLCLEICTAPLAPLALLRGSSAPAVYASVLQPRALCKFSLQERKLQLQRGAYVTVQEVVCAQQRPRLALGVRDAAGPLRLTCLQAQAFVDMHVVRTGCVLVQDDLQAAGDSRPNLTV
ncbi:Protein of unknown function [Gryllus bimaculatus]|nr:Protein of unknown function [Gryllus bimaculatus]